MSPRSAEARGRVAGTVTARTAHGAHSGSVDLQSEEAVVSDYDVMLADCPARSTLELISGTWTIVVLVGLAHGPRRYSELLERAGGISKKMLTQTLRRLAESGLVTRPAPRGAGYELTRLGESLLVPLTSLTEWAEQHADELAAG